MAIVNFYLKNPKEKGDSLIYLFYSYDGKRLKCSTGETINSASWNPETQRVKKSIKGSSEINDCLEKVEEDIKRIYRTLKAQNLPISNEILKIKLFEGSSNKQKEKPTLFVFAEEYINSIISLRKSSSIVVYRNALKILKEYKQFSQKRIDFDTIGLDFYNDYSDYLTRQKNFRTNTIGKHFKTIKTFMNEATERGINTNMDFQSKRFKVVQEDVDSIYLDNTEIDTLYNLDLSTNKKLEKVRDLFIVGCLTGLRFSDFTQLRYDNITNGKIKIRTQKTNSTVVIPVHPRVNEILKKYDNALPAAFSNQKMNEYLKEIGLEAEINDKVQQIEFKNGKREMSFVSKYQLITTHTARRSFATNLLKAGFPAMSIMKITGHQTEKAFMKYVKITSEQNADMLERFWNETQLLKAV